MNAPLSKFIKALEQNQITQDIKKINSPTEWLTHESNDENSCQMRKRFFRFSLFFVQDIHWIRILQEKEENETLKKTFWL